MKEVVRKFFGEMADQEPADIVIYNDYAFWKRALNNENISALIWLWQHANEQQEGMYSQLMEKINEFKNPKEFYNQAPAVLVFYLSLIFASYDGKPEDFVKEFAPNVVFFEEFNKICKLFVQYEAELEQSSKLREFLIAAAKYLYSTNFFFSIQTIDQFVLQPDDENEQDAFFLDIVKKVFDRDFPGIQSLDFFLRKTASDPEKTYIDLLFENKEYDVLAKLVKRLIPILKAANKDFEALKKISQKYFKSLSYEYEPENPRKNEIYIYLLHVTVLTKKEQGALYEHLGDIVVNRVRENYPYLKKHNEILLKMPLTYLRRFKDHLESRNDPKLVDFMFKVNAAINFPSEGPIDDLILEAESKVKPRTVDTSLEFEDESEEVSTNFESKKNIFSKSEWGNTKNQFARKIFGEATGLTQLSEDVIKALDHLARHARWHLEITGSSDRAKAASAKLAALKALFAEFNLVEGETERDRLTAIKEIIEGKFSDYSYHRSDLLKNRKGFFGAYKSYSQLLSFFGVKHFRYKSDRIDQTSLSSVHHYLIELCDAINKQIDTLKPSVVEEQVDSNDLRID